MKIGNLLRQLRNAKKLSQQEVAEQVGVCQSTYFAWENDRCLPKTAQYVRLSTVLGFSSNDLTLGELALIMPQTGMDKQEQTVPNAQYLYEEIAASQKQIIHLQQQRISQLEKDNQQLKEQLETWSSGELI